MHRCLHCGARAASCEPQKSPVHSTLWMSLDSMSSPFCRSTAEGPEPFLGSDGHVYLLYSGANTWDGTYAVGVARAATENPLDGFDKELPDARILRTGGQALGPGHSSHPVVGPNGDEYLLYHAQLGATGHARARKLMLDRFDWRGAWPQVHDGRPSLSPQPTP